MWLHYTDKEIWGLTPRQLKAQLAVHEDVMKQMYGTPDKASTPMGYIDQIKGW